MPKIIDADALREALYHEAFETDSSMQKWDSGCWIRYKMFENAIEAAKPIDAVPVVRCKYCKHYKDGWCYNPNTYDDEKTRGNTIPDWFCADGKRRE